MIRQYRQVILALCAALLGAALFSAMQVPAGSLVGSTLAVTGLAALGLSPSVPKILRDIAFVTIGTTLGAGITPHFLSDLARFPASLLALTATLVAVMAVSSTVLRRFFGASAPTALLATSPGALSYSLSLATEGASVAVDVRFIVLLQSLRLLLITVILPPVIAVVDGVGGGHAVVTTIAHTLELPTSVVLIALASAAGFLLERFRLPAAYLLAGVIVSGLGHGVGVLEGRPSAILTFFGFSIAGAVIGARFSSITAGQLRSLLLAGLVATSIAVGLSGLMSLAVATWLDLPFGQVWVAFAPGGVEGMSAMALTLGYDPVYVAVHHIYRLIVLLVFLPALLKRASRQNHAVTH